MRLALLALVPVILIQSSVLTNGLHYISGVVESRCTLTACITVSISTPAHSRINLLIRHSLDHSTQTHYLSLCLGSVGGYSNYFWNDSKTLMERAPQRDRVAFSLGSNSNQFQQFIIIGFCWIRFGLTPLINHLSSLFCIISLLRLDFDPIVSLRLAWLS